MCFRCNLPLEGRAGCGGGSSAVTWGVGGWPRALGMRWVEEESAWGDSGWGLNSKAVMALGEVGKAQGRRTRRGRRFSSARWLQFGGLL